MKKSYTLNRFYSEAKGLIEKYQVNMPDHVLEASIEMGERGGDVRLNCCIRYRINYEYTLFAAEPTPEAALLRFEADIIQSINGSTTT